jgi:hypothetical protein
VSRETRKGTISEVVGRESWGEDTEVAGEWRLYTGEGGELRPAGQQCRRAFVNPAACGPGGLRAPRKRPLPSKCLRAPVGAVALEEESLRRPGDAPLPTPRQHRGAAPSPAATHSPLSFLPAGCCAPRGCVRVPLLYAPPIRGNTSACGSRRPLSYCVVSPHSHAEICFLRSCPVCAFLTRRFQVWPALNYCCSGVARRRLEAACAAARLAARLWRRRGCGKAEFCGPRRAEREGRAECARQLQRRGGRDPRGRRSAWRGAPRGREGQRRLPWCGAATGNARKVAPPAKRLQRLEPSMIERLGCELLTILRIPRWILNHCVFPACQSFLGPSRWRPGRRVGCRRRGCGGRAACNVRTLRQTRAGARDMRAARGSGHALVPDGVPMGGGEERRQRKREWAGHPIEQLRANEQRWKKGFAG